MKAEAEIKKAVCTFCKGECGVLVHVKDGHLVKIEVDPVWQPRYPPTKGCVRLRAAKEWFYHPDRVNFPLKRTGERGEGKWQRIPWGQALDEIAQRLGDIKDKYGAESIAFTEGTSYRHDRPSKFRFFNAIGSMNAIGSAHI